MRRVVLYIAMSLDGYIADVNGGVDWLVGEKSEAESIDTYAMFIEDVDTIVMGWRTYQQVRVELSPGKWPYQGLNCYVLTHREILPEAGIEFVNGSAAELLEGLRRQEGKNIWICGGADVIRQLMQADLIDCWHIAVIPTLLGKGIRLFAEIPSEQRLHLLKTVNYNGIVELIYEKAA